MSVPQSMRASLESSYWADLDPDQLLHISSLRASGQEHGVEGEVETGDVRDGDVHLSAGRKTSEPGISRRPWPLLLPQ